MMSAPPIAPHGRGAVGQLVILWKPLLLLASTLLVFLVAAPVRAQAPDSFAVEGQISNGTAGGEAPGSARVRAYAYTRERVDGPWEAQVDEAGAYRLESVPSIEGAVYVLGVDYSGASYAERFEHPAAGQVVTRDLTVFETSPVDPGLRFEQVALLLGSVDGSQSTISVVEIHRLENPTDRTFAPSPSGPGGPAGLLVFPLPSGAFDLRPEVGLDPARIIQIDRGFASMTPIPPGRTEIGFSYRFPYTDSTFELARIVRYPVSRLNVLVAEEGPRVEAEGLSVGETASVGGRTYRTFAGGPFTVGQPLSITLSGLPLPGGPLGRIPPAAVAVAGVLFGLAVLVYAAARKKATPHAAPSADAVLDGLVALELERANSQISEEEYERARGLLVEELRPLGRSEP